MGSDVVRLGQAAPREDGRTGRLEVSPGIAVWFRVLGAGPEVVIVPTTGNDVDLEPIASPGRTVVFYDTRGRGRSDPVGDEDAGFAEDVADLESVRRAFGLDRFAALAWSYHAGVLVTHALQHRGHVSRLVLVSSIPVRADARPAPARQPAPHQVAHLDQLEAAGTRASDPAAMCRAWREVYVPLLMGRPEAFERLSPVCALPNEHPWVVARSLVHVFAQLQTYDWRPLLPALDIPTLVVHGSEDREPVEHAMEWIDALPDARLLELDGIGQLPWAEDPDRFFTAVGRFLDGESI
jgi:proline iminopeptidase